MLMVKLKTKLSRKHKRVVWLNGVKRFWVGAVAFIVIAVGFGVAMVLHSFAAVEPIGVAGNWNLVFDDEFNESTLDPNIWSNTWFSGANSTSGSNVSLSGGNLVLQVSSSSQALVDTDPSQTPKGFQFGTGYYAEARIYFAGSGSTIDNWPAFWTDGQQWPGNGEIDIAEGLGTLTSNYWYGTGNGTPNNSGTIPGNWGGSWHTYGLDRENGTNYIYWDGKLIRSNTTYDNGVPHYLIFSTGPGNGPTVTGPNGAIKIDYVRVWKYAGASTPTPPPTPLPTPLPTHATTPVAVSATQPPATPSNPGSVGMGSASGTASSSSGSGGSTTLSPSPGAQSANGSSPGQSSDTSLSSARPKSNQSLLNLGLIVGLTLVIVLCIGGLGAFGAWRLRRSRGQGSHWP